MFFFCFFFANVMETGVFIICLDILGSEVSCTDNIQRNISSSSFMEDAIHTVLSIPARPPVYWELLVCTFACAPHSHKYTHVRVDGGGTRL